MPRPICVKCEREMTVERAGTVELFAIVLGPGAYQQWQGDLCRCPSCGARFVTAYGQRPTWEHFQGEEERDKHPMVRSYEMGVRPDGAKN